MDKSEKLKRTIFDYYADHGRMPDSIKMSHQTLNCLRMELQDCGHVRFEPTEQNKFCGVPIEISDQPEPTLHGVVDRSMGLELPPSVSVLEHITEKP